MVTDDINQKRKEILSQLIVSEKETLDKLQELVQLTKPFMKIDEKGKIIFTREYKLSNPEKIELFLIGKYFAYNLEIIDQPSIDLNQISKELGIKKTTLSAPLGRLVDADLISKPESSMYQIVHHEVENILRSINGKYVISVKK